jgi:hypothetical protein
MERKVKLIMLFFCVGTITARSQALQHLQLKIPDRVDMLFAELKTDSNYISYVSLQQDAVSAGKKYMDSLAIHGQKQTNIFSDTTGKHAPLLQETNRKMQSAVQLKFLLDKQYPLLGQLSYSEETKLKRLSLDYYQRQHQLP